MLFSLNFGFTVSKFIFLMHLSAECSCRMNSSMPGAGQAFLKKGVHLFIRVGVRFAHVIEFFLNIP